MTATVTSTVAPPRTSRRGWVALAALVVVAVIVLVVVGVGGSAGPEPLSTTSTQGDGSRALARLLAARGTDVHETSSLADATDRTGETDRTILVLDPTAYSAAQLRQIAAATTGPVVLLEPADDALDALGLDAALDTDATAESGVVSAGCDVESAAEAGPVDFDQSLTYTVKNTTVAQCYNGRLLQQDRIVALGDLGLLTNDRLATTGAAALDLNVLGSTSSLVWLRPGADADGPTGSVWDALPPHSLSAAIWLLVVGLLLVLWRGRRLGVPVVEPLPVVVRSAEIVHGRARLYQRTGAFEPASNALRRATVTRLQRRLALPASTSVEGVEYAVGQRLARTGEALQPGILRGPVPADEAELTRLAAALRDVEIRVERAGQAG